MALASFDGETVKSWPFNGRNGLCHSVEIGGMQIRLIQQGVDNFTVVYWQQVKRNLTYAKAAAEYGACIMHACACASQLDNRELRGKSRG
jgi:hypothetical protein